MDRTPDLQINPGVNRLQSDALPAELNPLLEVKACAKIFPIYPKQTTGGFIWEIHSGGPHSKWSSMRSLPWLKDGSEPPPGALKRKRPIPAEKPLPEPVPAPSEASSSDSEETTVLENTADNAYDAMIQGYDHDDAYIMVEHDLVEAAKQVTRHIHLEAYQKQAAAPITGEITRPTTCKPKQQQSVVDGETSADDEEEVKDGSTLGELLRRRPTATLGPATPIKRKQERVLETREVKTIDLTLDGSQREKEINGPKEVARKTAREENRIVETDDDDEDLDKPPKKVFRPEISLLTRQAPKISSISSRTSSRISNTTSNSTSFKASDTNKPSKRPVKAVLDPDWMFNSLWDDPPGPKRPLVKRDKVSLAAQLDESSLKLFNNKKAISLKDQFKFMES